MFLIKTCFSLYVLKGGMWLLAQNPNILYKISFTPATKIYSVLGFIIKPRSKFKTVSAGLVGLGCRLQVITIATVTSILHQRWTHTHTQYEQGTWYHLRLLLLCTISGSTSETNKFPFPYLLLIFHQQRAPCVQR